MRARRGIKFWPDLLFCVDGCQWVGFGLVFCLFVCVWLLGGSECVRVCVCVCVCWESALFNESKLSVFCWKFYLKYKKRLKFLNNYLTWSITTTPLMGLLS